MAIYGCSGLTSLVIPQSMRTIDYAAFMGCSGVKSVTILANVMDVGDSLFFACDGVDVLYLKEGVYEQYKYSVLWQNGAAIVEIVPPFVIGDADAEVMGDFDNGFVVRPSAGKTDKFICPRCWLARSAFSRPAVFRPTGRTA